MNSNILYMESTESNRICHSTYLSPGSTSRRPMYAMFFADKLKIIEKISLLENYRQEFHSNAVYTLRQCILGNYHGLMNSNPGSLLMYGWSSFTRNDKGIPCMFPDDDVSGVLMSACASTQTTTCSGSAKEWPKIEPMAMLWSPPRAKQVLPDLMTLYTSAAICQREYHN